MVFELLAYEQFVLLHETVGRDLEVEWRRALADPPRNVIVGTMAWAEPTTKVSCVWQWDAAEVSAHGVDPVGGQRLVLLHHQVRGVTLHARARRRRTQTRRP